jgi:hypothetical protein
MQMDEYGFGHKSHDLNYLEVGIFLIFPNFIIYLRASSHNFVENHQFAVILSYFKKNLNIYLFKITYLHTTCTVF